MPASRSTPKAKRSYNLRLSTIELVKRLVDVEHIAPTQDALVERAIGKLARTLQEDIDARAWSRAARDPSVSAEDAQIEQEFPLTDTAWLE